MEEKKLIQNTITKNWLKKNGYKAISNRMTCDGVLTKYLHPITKEVHWKFRSYEGEIRFI